MKALALLAIYIMFSAPLRLVAASSEFVNLRSNSTSCGLTDNTPPDAEHEPTLGELPETYWAQVGTSSFTELKVALVSDFEAVPFLGISLTEQNIIDVTATVLNVETGSISIYSRSLYEGAWLISKEYSPPSLGGEDPAYLGYLNYLLGEAEAHHQGKKQYPFEVRPELSEAVDYLKFLLQREQP